VLDGEFALTGHHGSVGEHVLVVRNIQGQETCRRPGNSAVAAISLYRIQVRGDGLVPAPAPNVNVRGHVNIMSNARLQRAQAVGRAVRALGMWRSLNGVDVEMIR
jgi:hypothetical protein